MSGYETTWCVLMHKQSINHISLIGLGVMQSHSLCMQATIARGSSGYRPATLLKSYALRSLLSLKKLLEKVFKYSNHGFATRQECTSQPSINGTLDIICQIPLFHGKLHWVLCQMIANLNDASHAMVS